jgi:DNA-binding LacI/PurR family transcriptional regulator
MPCCVVNRPLGRIEALRPERAQEGFNEMVEKVTSWDVARRAGVSRTTVSMVLNKSDAVSLSVETRRRVMQAASDLGYKPNSAARMLVRGDTETIGLIISDPAILPIDGFVPQLMHGISEFNREHGYHVLLEGVKADEGANPYESLVESRRIDGMIVLNPRSDDPNLKDLIDRGYPVVLVGSVRHPEELSVNFTTGEGISAAVDHLVSRGHRHIGTVPFSGRGLVGTDVRLSVLRRALAGHNLALPDSHVEHAAFSAESGHFATRRLLERHPEFSAIMAGNDTIAIGCISAAHALGRSIPKDLSLVGFDDLPFAAWLTPALTTIQVDAIQQGKMAAELLIRRLRDEPITERQLRLPTSLVIRQSTAPAR